MTTSIVSSGLVRPRAPLAGSERSKESRTKVRRWLRVAIAAGVLVSSVLGVTAAYAAPTTMWAQWGPLEGSAGAYVGSVQLASTPQLTAAYTSDSRGGQVGVISGASTWLSEGTPVGAKYGSSRGFPYVNLRPRADTSTGQSTTTYTFARPTPTSGWTFVLGDIDADQVAIRAIGPAGVALTAAQLGFRGGFNYCAPGVSGRPSCAGDALDVPGWDPTTLTLTGNTAAVDTSGSAAWFEPSAPISSLTFSFLRRSGFPVYQTWFASIARDITGTVSDDVTGPVPGVAVRLFDEYGNLVSETATDSNGSYVFSGIVATNGYNVEATAPAGKVGTDGLRKSADLSASDARADFAVRDIVPVSVSGRVTDAQGQPLAGVAVTLTSDAGTLTATTSEDGRYHLAAVPVGTYQPTIAVPNGYSLGSAPEPITVPPDSEDPITDQSFVLVRYPTVSGQVLASAMGVAGVTVSIVGEETYTATTDSEGRYTATLIEPGAYRISISPPDGYLAAGPTSRDEDITTDRGDIDFTLVKTGLIAGVVIDDAGAAIPEATVTVTGPQGTVAVTTDSSGGFAVTGLPPGGYRVELVPPAGYTLVGSPTRNVELTGAGESLDVSFELIPVPSGPDPGSEKPAPPGPSARPSSPDSRHLPITGADSHTALIAGIALIAMGAGAMTFAGLSTRRK